jgi:hypothetical protein
VTSRKGNSGNYYISDDENRCNNIKGSRSHARRSSLQTKFFHLTSFEAKVTSLVAKFTDQTVPLAPQPLEVLRLLISPDCYLFVIMGIDQGRIGQSAQ